LKTEDKISSTGIITSRECPVCGHHEIGYTTKDGDFHPLKPGALIQILKDPEMPVGLEKDGAHLQSVVEEENGVIGSANEIWIPDPVRNNKELCLKYGITVGGEFVTGEISGNTYRVAYLGKLQRLIEKEIDTPLPVILDRFFTAAHLAAGSPREITEAMWRELDEIRQPVLLVSEWLKKQDEESLARMAHPIGMEALTDRPISDEQLQRELEELSLEAFLELL
jgi:hypothetical protein